MNLKKIIIGTLIGLSSLSPLQAGTVHGFSTVNANACYTKRRIPIDYNVAFNTMKDTFLKSSINLVNLSKEDGFIYGKGSLRKGDSFYTITITVNFKKMGDLVQIDTKASYTLMKEEYATESGGVAGINFPMPVLWKKEMSLKDTGNIQDPNFYMGFYLNYQKVLFDNLMLKGDVILAKKKTTPKVEKKVSKQISKPVQKKEVSKTDAVKKEKQEVKPKVAPKKEQKEAPKKETAKKQEVSKKIEKETVKTKKVVEKTQTEETK